MLSFAPVTHAHRQEASKLLWDSNYRICECSFVDLFIWRHKYGSEICLRDGFIFIRFKICGEYLYMCPIGSGDFKAAMLLLERYCEEENHPLRFSCLTSEMTEKLEEFFPGRYEFYEHRDGADYIYLAKNMIELRGKKFHSKRNFINRFMEKYHNRWEFLPIDSKNLSSIREFELNWYRKNHSSEVDKNAETTAISCLLNNMEELGAVGGTLIADGKLVGFSLGSQNCADTFVVHIEKADWEVPGAYQVLNREFASAFCRDVTYINREDDLGLEGLRKAKLSYRPLEVKMKYQGGLKTGANTIVSTFFHGCVAGAQCL